jgi:hypothetical protein
MITLQALPKPETFGLRRGAFAVIAVAACGAALLLGGCASTPEKPQPMLDPQANFGAYRTFALTTPEGETGGQPVSIVEGYIRTALATEMKRKGYEEAAAGTAPDLRVEYEAVKAEKLKNNPFRIGIGVGSYGSSGGGSVGVGTPSVKNVTEGSLVIHVIDNSRNAEAWRSGVTREIDKGGVAEAAVKAAVADAMEAMPARTAR